MSVHVQADIGKTYEQSCAACHDTGAFDAPKKGDTATWQQLKSQKGIEKLVKSTRQGMPQMPAMGLCQSCSDKDFADLIDYMSR
ncbi:c-type cytochrome [Moraxella marmotae]|uniref:c-type cytochrome n=1 Tax=Moraxella marmotae TaxID=3344520 RepID=UPI0035D43DC1